MCSIRLLLYRRRLARHSAERQRLGSRKF